MTKIAPLSWEDNFYLEAATAVGGYVIIPEKRELWFHSDEFVHYDDFEKKRLLLARGPADELKGVAFDHYEAIVRRMIAT